VCGAWVVANPDDRPCFGLCTSDDTQLPDSMRKAPGILPPECPSPGPHAHAPQPEPPARKIYENQAEARAGAYMHVCDKQAGMCPGPCGLCMVKKTKVFVSPFTSNFMFEQVSCGVSMKTLIASIASVVKELTLLQDPEVAVGITAPRRTLSPLSPTAPSHVRHASQPLTAFLGDDPTHWHRFPLHIGVSPLIGPSPRGCSKESAQASARKEGAPGSEGTSANAAADEWF
jgi:hypothetical protein